MRLLKRLAARGARVLDVLSLDGVSPFDLATPGFSIASTKLVRAIAAQCGAPGTVLDVGANVGQFALAALRAFPQARVISFEPVPETAAVLKRNLRGDARAEVRECALGRSDGEVTFFRNAYSHVSSALPIHPDNAHPNYDAAAVTPIRVPLRRLDHVIEPGLLRGPVGLKLDAQGFEAEVLAGATSLLPQVDWIVMEISFVPLYEGQPSFEALDALARELGYAFVAPVGVQTGRDDMIIEMDALYRRTGTGGAGAA